MCTSQPQHPLTHPLTHSLTHPLTHPLSNPSYLALTLHTPTFSPPSHHLFTHLLIHPLTHPHRSFTVRVHVGLDTFISSTGMEEVGGVISSSSSSSSSTQQPMYWHNGIVARAPHEVENAFQEVSKSLIPMVAENNVGAAAGSTEVDDDDVDFNSTAGEMSAGGTPESPLRREYRGGSGSSGTGGGKHHRSPISPIEGPTGIRARSISPSSVNNSLSAGSMDPPSSATPSPSTKSIYSEFSKVTEATTARMQHHPNGTTILHYPTTLI